MGPQPWAITFPAPRLYPTETLKSVTGCMAEASAEIELQALVAGRHPLTNLLHHFHANLHGTASLPAERLNGRQLGRSA